MIHQDYTQRKQVIGAQVKDLVSLRGPRTPQQKTRLKALLEEVDELAVEERTQGETLAFRAFLLRGHDGITAEQRQRLREARDMGEVGLGSGAASGAGILVPVSFMNRVTSAMKSYSNLLSLCTILPTMTGRNLPYPADNDAQVSGELLGEAQQATVADINSPSQVILGAFRLSSKILRLSNELVQDQEIAIDEYLARQMGTRLARIISQLGTTGTGGGTQPTGYMNSATIVNAGVAVGAGASDGVSGSNSIGVADLATLESALDVAYRAAARFWVHPNTLQAMRGQLDKEGRPLFPGLHNSPDGVNRLLNYPLETNPFMDTLQSGPTSPPVTRKPIAFMDASRFTVRLAPLVLWRIVERWAEFDQSAWLAMQRGDCNFTDIGACAAYLETSY